MKKITLILLISAVIGLLSCTNMNLFAQNTITRIDESNYFSNGTKTYFVMSNILNSSGFLGDSKSWVADTLTISTNSDVYIPFHDEFQFYAKNAVIVSPDIFQGNERRHSSVGTVAIELPINYSKTLKAISENYTQINNKIFYEYLMLEHTDIASFKVLKDSYYGAFSKDKNHVYYNEETIEDAIPKTFKVVENGYSKDTKSVFFKAKKVAFANPEKLKILKGYTYAKDNKSVYNSGNVILDADPKTYEIIGRYNKDKNHVWIDDKITKLNPNTFRVLKYRNANNEERESTTSTDNIHVYYFDKLIAKADGKTFHLPFLTSDYGIDKNHVWIEGKITDIDPNTFKILKYSGVQIKYSVDKNYVYYGHRSEKIPNADPETFHFSFPNDETYAVDKNHVFYNGRVITEADTKTFHLPFKYRDYAFDKQDVFYRGEKIEFADQKTFIPFLNHSDYAVDKQHVFYKEKLLKSINVKTFISKADSILNNNRGVNLVTQVYHLIDKLEDGSQQDEIFRSTDNSSEKNFFLKLGGSYATLYGWFNQGKDTIYYRTKGILEQDSLGTMCIEFGGAEFTTTKITENNLNEFKENKRINFWDNLPSHYSRFFKGERTDSTIKFSAVKGFSFGNSYSFEFEKINKP